jgi:hypothetical protein
MQLLLNDAQKIKAAKEEELCGAGDNMLIL